MGMMQRILKINEYDLEKPVEEIMEWDKYAFEDENLFHELLKRRTSNSFVGAFTVDGEELNQILGREEFRLMDTFLILWDN